jgi:hypothetical protein
MVTDDAAQTGNGFVQKGWIEISNAVQALVRVVMKEYQSSLAIDVQPKYRSLLGKCD